MSADRDEGPDPTRKDAIFAPDWLALREPVDHRSRSAALTDRLARAVERRGWTRGLDLGCGSGSNLRYLAPRIPGLRRWTALDHDPALLERVTLPGPGELERLQGDLADEGLEAVGRVDVVTASALLDLVSATWVDRLVGRCRDAGAAALFALSYDGSVVWSTADADDALVHGAVNRHQERDKGLGAALGPQAGSATARAFEASGFEVLTAPTPWVLADPAESPLVVRLVDGWVEAACEVEPVGAARFAAWGRRRVREFRDGAVELRVGHVDVLALPREP
ncbi:MAG: class I SAM-dependent methyltransferase [Gemmatimonadetes bacterium]|nr:class I SAM-dependent methyltransferase [Gemmatimonadota bacterium]